MDDILCGIVGQRVDQVEWGIIQVTLGWEMVKKERLPDETLLRQGRP